MDSGFLLGNYQLSLEDLMEDPFKPLALASEKFLTSVDLTLKSRRFAGPLSYLLLLRCYPLSGQNHIAPKAGIHSKGISPQPFILSSSFTRPPFDTPEKDNLYLTVPRQGPQDLC